jgi:hypothetical protein
MPVSILPAQLHHFLLAALPFLETVEKYTNLHAVSKKQLLASTQYIYPCHFWTEIIQLCSK